MLKKLYKCNLHAKYLNLVYIKVEQELSHIQFVTQYMQKTAKFKDRPSELPELDQTGVATEKKQGWVQMLLVETDYNLCMYAANQRQ